MIRDDHHIKVKLLILRREIIRELDCTISVANEIIQSYWEDFLNAEYRPQLLLEI